MKVRILVLVLILSAFFGVYGQASGPIDLILLLDTSSTMSSSYDAVNNYTTTGMLREFLRVGDTFHLIPFSGSPRLDVARRIEGRGDVETIIGRILLQYPLESRSNISAALGYVEAYVNTLPSRPKKIVLVSDSTGQDSQIEAARARLSPRGVTLDFVRITHGQPLANLPASGRPAASPAPAQVTQAPPAATTTRPPTASSTQPPAASTTQPPAATTQAQPPAAQTQGPASTVTQPPATTQVQPPATQTQVPSTTPVWDTEPAPSGTTGPAEAADTFQAQPTDSGVTGRPVDAAQDSETPGTWESTTGEPAAPFVFTPTEQPAQRTRRAFPIALIIALLAAALIIGFLILLFARRSRSGSTRVMPFGSSNEQEGLPPFMDHSKDLAEYAAGQSRHRVTPYQDRATIVAARNVDPSQPLLINLFVEDQRTSIGKRNVHSLKSNFSYTVGGGRSDFLIFLVPIPPSIGELRRDGSGVCTFIPRKPKYFPDLGSQTLHDCLGKTIRIISDKNYELRVRFIPYEDPLEALNRLLNSLKVPGPTNK
ncbi:MAG: hypothetical protein FWG99_04345 [Treponema sp.]|nr:hypothetical protein [Treponema sp.]